MKVKDIMSPIIDHLDPEDSLQEAVVKMHAVKRGHDLSVKGMVVLDAGGNLAGILSIKDILRAVIPVYLDPKISRLSWDGMLEEMSRRVACRKVREFMTARVTTIPADATLMTCAGLLIERKLQRLPVVDAGGGVAGIVYIRDVYDVISQILIGHPECRL